MIYIVGIILICDVKLIYFLMRTYSVIILFNSLVSC